MTDSQRKDYEEILEKMENLVSHLQNLGTPEALEAIDPKTLENIERIKKLLSKDTNE
jgi:hypothetical protein